MKERRFIIFLILISIFGLITRPAYGFNEPEMIVPAIVYQGGLISIEIIGDELSAPEQIVGSAGEKKLNFFRYNKHMAALFVVDINQNSGWLDIDVVLPQWDFKQFSRKVYVTEKWWPKRRVPEPPELKGKNLAQWLKEKDLIETALKTSENQPMWRESFVYPLNKLLETSPFGEKRISPIKIKHHKGTDFRAASGTSVSAINSGRVVLTGNFMADGKIVIIDHGLGLHSLYLHLSRIMVKNGQMVKRGQIIGKAGNTGSSNGSHLHLETRLNGEPFDPLQIFNILK